MDDAKIGNQVNQFQYAGSWEHVTRHTDGRSFGTSARSFHTGDEAMMTFAGTGIELYGVVGPRGGLALLTVDGKPSVPDFYAPKITSNALVYENPSLRPGMHLLTVTVAGAHVKGSLGNYVNIDGVVIFSQSNDDAGW